VVSVHTYHVPTADGSIGENHMSAVVDQLRKRAGGHLPVWTALGEKALGIPEMHIEGEGVAIVGSDDKQPNSIAIRIAVARRDNTTPTPRSSMDCAPAPFIPPQPR